jgi:hypothetical protein
VLRFRPVTVIVRSRVAGGAAWQATIDGDLRRLEIGPWTAGRPGTEVELRRPSTGEDLALRIAEVVRRDVGWLRRRGCQDERVEIRVDDRVVVHEPSIPPPSVAFRRHGIRGLVGFADAPRVDLYSHGLRVRTTATLDELVEGAGDRVVTGSRSFSPGLAPRVIVDADGLELMAARGDARSDRELQRVVRTARRALDRLVAVQLESVAPLGLLRRAAAAVQRAWTRLRARRVVVAVGSVAIAAAGMATVLVMRSGADRDQIAPAVVPAARPIAVTVDMRDLHRGYDAPGVGLAAGEVVADVTYAPQALEPWMAVLRRVAPHRGPDDMRRDDGPPCTAGCLTVSMALDGPGHVPLPEPTGWRIDPASVRVDGRPIDVWRTAAGTAIVDMSHVGGAVIEWRAGRAPGPEVRAAAAWPVLPSEAQWVADAASGDPFDAVVDRLEAWVRTRVRYDRSSATVARHRLLEASGMGLFERIVEVGAGDCDLQNALLAAMLERAGIRARLAVGLLGSNGRAAPGLHAWVEARAPDDHWRVVDASTPRPVPMTVAAATRPSTPSGAVQASDRPQWPASWIGAACAAMLVFAAWIVVRRGGVHRRVDPAGELPGELLVRTALDRPGALGPRAALGRRPLVPTLDGRVLSTDRCRRLARDRRLAACRSPERWRAVVDGGGVATVDLREPAGRELLTALRVPTVDDWAPLLDAASSTDVTGRVEGALWREGVHWSVREIPSAPEPAVAVVGWRLPAGSRRRAVLVRRPGGSPPRPSEVLDLARAAGDAIGLDERTVRRVLARLARDLLAEAGP